MPRRSGIFQGRTSPTRWGCKTILFPRSLIFLAGIILLQEDKPPAGVVEVMYFEQRLTALPIQATGAGVTAPDKITWGRGSTGGVTRTHGIVLSEIGGAMDDICIGSVGPKAAFLKSGGKLGDMNGLFITSESQGRIRSIQAPRGHRRGISLGYHVDQGVFIVSGIEHPSQGQLFLIAQAGGGHGLRLGLGKRRQKHRRQNGDDGYDHQQFD